MLSRLTNQRGSVLLFTTALLAFLLVFSGLAVDMAFYMAAKGELQKSLDAAALAGAGKLGFNDSVFPDVRNFAHNYALFNGLHKLRGSGGDIVALDLNAANDVGGNIVLGVWDPRNPPGVGAGLRFEPSLDGTIVNAVLCQKTMAVDTTFLRLLGFNGLTIGGFAIGVANPPIAPPPDACLFPIGVGSCPFQGDTSLGCGTAITFITSSGKGAGDEGAACISPPCTNSAAFVSFDLTQNPNPSYLAGPTGYIEQLANGVCPPTPLQTGQDIPTNNGMQQPTMDSVEAAFRTKCISPTCTGNNCPMICPTVTVTDEARQINTYEGPGWKVHIPVIETACPTGAISGPHKIVGWTEFVMTQVINKGKCVAANPYPGNQWDVFCSDPKLPNSTRAIFGYYSCQMEKVNPIPVPGPRSALATRLRLVQ